VNREWSRGAIGVAGLLVAAALAFTLKVSDKMEDFEVYHRAAARALAGEPLYRPEDGHWLFKYLPAFALVISPLALVPEQAAKAIWFFASVASLVLLLRTSVALLPQRRKPAWLLVVATVGVMAKFYAHELELGQSNLFLATAATAALLAVQRARESFGGVLVSVAAICKPYAVIFYPWLLARRRAASVISAGVAMVAALLLPVARYGMGPAIALHVDWWHTVTTSIEPNLLNGDNISWLAMYSRWWQPGAAARWVTAGTALTMLGAVVYVMRRRRTVSSPELLEGGLLLTLIPLLSPQGWDYTLLGATPAVMCLVNYEDRLPPALRWSAITAMAVIALSIYDVMGRTLYAAFMNNSGITLACFVLIGALVVLRCRQIA
jgi:hypothetical protein